MLVTWAKTDVIGCASVTGTKAVCRDLISPYDVHEACARRCGAKIVYVDLVSLQFQDFISCAWDSWQNVQLEQITGRG